MARKLSFGNAITSFLMIIIILLALNTKVQSLHQFDFVKFSIGWPQSFCNTGNPSITCRHPIKQHFVIHGLWPTYWPNVEVPPFEEDNGCTSTPPMPKDYITNELLTPILGDMETYWPSLRYNRGVSISDTNINFWKHEWEKHGMCFLQPDRPLYYFQIAVNLIKTYNLLNILYTGLIIPDNGQYTRIHIETTIQNHLGVPALVHCNRDVHGNRQLKEIHICFSEHAELIACPQFANVDPNDPSRRQEQIKFPAPNPTARR